MRSNTTFRQRRQGRAWQRYRDACAMLLRLCGRWDSPVIRRPGVRGRGTR